MRTPTLYDVPNRETFHVPLDYDWDLHVLPQLVKTIRPFLTELSILEVSHYFIAGHRFDVSIDAVATLSVVAPSLHTLCLPSPNTGLPEPKPLTLANLCRLPFMPTANYINPEGLTWLLNLALWLEVIALDWDALVDADDYCDVPRVTDG